MNARQKAKKFKRENERLRDLFGYNNVRPIKFAPNHVEVRTYGARAKIDSQYGGLAESFAKRTIESGLFDEAMKHIEYRTIHEGPVDYLEGTITFVV